MNNVSNIKKFFLYTLINPTSSVIALALSFYNPLGDLMMDNFFSYFWIIGLVIYIYMACIYAAIIFLNYFIFSLKEKTSFDHFLNIYFYSQKIYWLWAWFITFPILSAFIALISALFVPGMGIFFSFIIAPFTSSIVKIILLIFGCSLMIWSHRTFVKLVRGEK